jgi:hypothetical protein
LHPTLGFLNEELNEGPTQYDPLTTSSDEQLNIMLKSSLFVLITLSAIGPTHRYFD